MYNDIFDFYYTGISAGWVWGYAPSHAHDNDIGFNHVHTLGQHVLSDMGGIYTLGVSPGTRVHDNCLHDIDSFITAAGDCIPTKAPATSCWRTTSFIARRPAASTSTTARTIVLRNNVFAFSEDRSAPAHADRAAQFVHLRAEHRLLGQHRAAAGTQLGRQSLQAREQCLLERCGAAREFSGRPDASAMAGRRGQDQGSLVADPKFVDPAEGDFRLRDDSPARKLGIQSLDARQAGRGGPPVLTRDLPPVPRAFD